MIDSPLDLYASRCSLTSAGRHEAALAALPNDLEAV
jgi:hypothetical protein